MSFSQRIGKEPVDKEMQLESMDGELRASLWNVFYGEVLSIAQRNALSDTRAYPLYKEIWANFFKHHLDNLPYDFHDAVEQIKQPFFGLPWNRAYDFIEHVSDHLHLMGFNPSTKKQINEKFNQVLQREFSAYRFVGGILSPIADKQEIETIKTVLSDTREGKLSGVHEHIKAALIKLSDRDAPDYRNSIKESISSVESIVKIIAAKPKATLGQALKIIDDNIGLHSALKEGFQKIYGWTNDGDGIRHALMEKSGLDFDDAKYMLVSCSAFVHYLIMKAQKSGITL